VSVSAPQADVRVAAPGSREPFWDNVRFVAIALVVVGHSIEKLAKADLMAAVYVAIYAFHMPLFAFVSGRFASAQPGRPAAAAKMVRQLVVPYVVFNVVWYLLRLAVEGHAQLDLATPYWHLWFLVALVVWRLLLPLVAAVRCPVTLSVGIAVAAGYMHGIGLTFDSGRIFGMLPFFVAGWALKERGLPRWVQERSAPSAGLRVAAVAVLVAVTATAYWQIGTVRDLDLRRWVQMSNNFEHLGAAAWWAGPLRLGLLGLAVVMGVAVLVLVPRDRTWFTAWGSATMYVYMLHLFPIYLLRTTTDVFSWFDSAPRFCLLIGLAVAGAALLSTSPVRRVFRPVVEPQVRWLFARAEVGVRA
jgi:fucose 4-O-acetylase-like acetyltransferase